MRYGTTDTLSSVLSSFISGFVVYLPKFFLGLLILLIGLIVATSLKKGVLVLFRILKLEKWLEEAKLGTGRSITLWQELFAELVRWTTVVLFLIPTAEMWGIPRFTDVLNRVLVYIPNVFVAAIVGLIGAVAANFVSDIIREGATALGSKSSRVLGGFSYYAILLFTVMVVLNQLGIAADLIRILFTGMVAMVAIAGGLAFGLGGKDLAKEVLEDLRKKLK
ncbi:hypothetical protein HY469_01330 [Candidatus Roizmanbacteria bacterium]|nr:hypothetical protein [Candidatus Roizmanbacteria bacterium]